MYGTLYFLSNLRNVMNLPKPLPNIETLYDLLELKEDFTLYWKVRPVKYFAGNNPELAAKRYNSRDAGKPAFDTISSKGYLHGHIFKEQYLTHRIIWKMIHGYDPQYIDHIDGNPLNNHIDNLRDVTFSENMKNQKIKRENPSKVMGVSLRKDLISKPWRAVIGIDGKSKTIGYFSSKEEAIAARKAAEIINGFHVNHGR
jgi:hypothetical protein